MVGVFPVALFGFEHAVMELTAETSASASADLCMGTRNLTAPRRGEKAHRCGTRARSSMETVMASTVRGAAPTMRSFARRLLSRDFGACTAMPTGPPLPSAGESLATPATATTEAANVTLATTTVIPWLRRRKTSVAEKLVSRGPDDRAVYGPDIFGGPDGNSNSAIASGASIVHGGGGAEGASSRPAT